MSRDQTFAAAAAIAVLAGLALGFRELGPPRQQRSENADLARARDLGAISRAVDDSYRLNQHLPATLDEVKKTHAGLRINDPESLVPYRYSVMQGTQYQLCANFVTDNRANSPAQFEIAHPAGTYCVSYAVNPTLILTP